MNPLGLEGKFYVPEHIRLHVFLGREDVAFVRFLKQSDPK